MKKGLNQLDIEKKLLEIDHKKLKCHPCIGNRVYARLIKIIDGDTLTVVIIHDATPLKFNIRVKGIDSPESKGKVSKIEKEAGLAVTNYVMELFKETKFVYIDVISTDKYGGRYIGDIYLDKECKLSLSSHLLKKQLVKQYDGKKKELWTEKELLHIICQTK